MTLMAPCFQTLVVECGAARRGTCPPSARAAAYGLQTQSSDSMVFKVKTEQLPDRTSCTTGQWVPSYYIAADDFAGKSPGAPGTVCRYCNYPLRYLYWRGAIDSYWRAGRRPRPGGSAGDRSAASPRC